MEEIAFYQVRARATGHFFDQATTRFFNSRYPQLAYKNGGNAYFITSEQFDHNSPRLYTIRVMDWQTGKTETVKDFQRYSTRAEALKELRKLLS